MLECSKGSNSPKFAKSSANAGSFREDFLLASMFQKKLWEILVDETDLNSSHIE